MISPKQGDSFKECPTCRFEWTDRGAFLSDPRLLLRGYQANFGSLGDGLFLFHHDLPDCGTCLAIEAEQFLDLREGPVCQERLTDTRQCPRFCFHEENLSPCPNQCECRSVRDVLQRIMNWPKDGCASNAAPKGHQP